MSTTTSPTLLGQEREFFDPALIALAVINLLSAFLTVCFLDEPFKWKKQPHDIVQFLLASLVAGAVSYGLTIELYGSVASTLLLFVSMCIFRLILPRLTAQANMKMICSLALAPMLLPWGYLWFEEIGMPDFIFIMYYVGAALSILLFPVGVFMVLPDAAMFTHKKFRRPHEPLPPRRSGLKVSLHLCCYAEPPDMVIESLQALTKMDYENFEVIVCDNNTKDTALWVPVKDACDRFNTEMGYSLFKFYHVDPIEGAKAGALNFCLTKTDPEAKFIGLLDADYQANPDFISTLIGFFDDEKIGYVQTPHFYRDRNESLYKKLSFWMYIKGYKVIFPSYSEYAMPITVGTMCLYRRQAIEVAGGWAEWCLTEDSEMSIRIHHHGFEGIFLNKIMGHGLIPECFADLRKQWFRWTAGPVKTLKYHFRMYLRAWFVPSSTKMHVWQKLLLYKQGVVIALPPITLVFGSIGTAVSIGLIYAGILPQINLLPVVWYALLIAFPTRLLDQWPFYELSGASSVKHMIFGLIGQAALTGVKIEAVAVALFTSRELPWVRTPKFTLHEPHYWWAFTSGSPLETRLFILSAVASVVCFCLGDILGDIAIVLGFSFVTIAVTFLSTVFMVIIGEASKTQKKKVNSIKPESDTEHGSTSDEENGSSDQNNNSIDEEAGRVSLSTDAAAKETSF